MSRWLSMLLVMALVSVMNLGHGQAIERVESVQVAVTSVHPLASVLQDRLKNSLATVTQQMLSGKGVDAVKERRGQYERVLQEVFSRVLFGYEVDWVEITPGQLTQVKMQVTPWGDLVDTVDVQVEYGNLPKELQPLLDKDIGNMQESVRNLFLGLPVDSEEWAIGVAKTELRELAAVQLPEYSVGVELVSGSHTVVRLLFVPNGPLVQDSRITLRSQTLPNLLLLDLKQDLSEVITGWRNLPVAWVQRHQDYFSQQLLTKAKMTPVTKRYDLTYQLQLFPASVTEVNLVAETTGYKIRAEGYLDMGRKENNTSAKFHVGRMITKQDELFGEVELYPTNFVWKFSGGFSHHFGKDTDIGIQYRAADGQNKVWLRQNITDHWQLRLERYPKLGDYEMGLRYRVHEFLSVEYVFTKQENWLRFIGIL